MVTAREAGARREARGAMAPAATAATASVLPHDLVGKTLEFLPSIYELYVCSRVDRAWSSEAKKLLAARRAALERSPCGPRGAIVEHWKTSNPPPKLDYRTLAEYAALAATSDSALYGHAVAMTRSPNEWAGADAALGGPSLSLCAEEGEEDSGSAAAPDKAGRGASLVSTAASLEEMLLLQGESSVGSRDISPPPGTPSLATSRDVPTMAAMDPQASLNVMHSLGGPGGGD